ncbi:MAG: metal ABC transporter ATP-binding protein [Phycisphaeraceae bacterium]|nr:metal ABC transporter ATP-binding protein [Phycisphaerae bacterium]MBX3392581.1 metal ABC transporter ATP-binding protein [Phycisphaeraceae bacterium]
MPLAPTRSSTFPGAGEEVSSPDGLSGTVPRGIAVEVHDVTVAYQRKPVLWDVDVSIPTERLVAIIGPNGAGKTTLLKAILGLVPLASGDIRILGMPPRKARPFVAYVPQRESVDWDFPVSAMDVVLMGRYGRLGWFRRPGRKDREAAVAVLDQVGMADLAGRQISQLSGGQQQRVFLARALVQEARLYFMDEPFAGVDAATEKAIVLLLQRIRASGGTVVAVHHDLQTVPEYFDHVVMLNTRLVASGPTASAFSPENLHRTYGGRLTLLDQAMEAVRRSATPGASE